MDVIGRVYSGAVDSKGNALYASWPFDARHRQRWLARVEDSGRRVVRSRASTSQWAHRRSRAIFTTPPTAVRAMGPEGFRYALNFDFDRDTAKVNATDATFERSAWQDVSARSADVSAFRKRGAK